MECLLPYLCMVTVPHIMVGSERMLDYRGAGLVRFHCIRYMNHNQECVLTRVPAEQVALCVLGGSLKFANSNATVKQHGTARKFYSGDQNFTRGQI